VRLTREVGDRTTPSPAFLLRSGEKGTFTLAYKVLNAGSQRPAATLTFLRHGKPFGDAIAMRRTGPTFLAETRVTTKKLLVLTARFTVTLGSSRDSRAIAVRVSPSQHP
jgi:hypothetical protein